jgi:dihydrofolate reductase
MAALLYSVTASVDGYIAGVGGDMSWLGELLTADAERDPLAEEVPGLTGALLVGARTWSGDDPHAGTDQEGAFEGAWSGPQVVLTHRPPPDPVPGTTFAGDLDSAVAAARDLAGERYVNVLGADVARQLLAADLLDEVLVFTAPVLLGDGVRVLDHPGGTRTRLDVVRRSTTGTWYRVVR